jgi:hypothetical protein
LVPPVTLANSMFAVGIIFSALMVFTAGLVTFLFGAMTISLAILNERGTASAPGGSLAIPLAILLIGLSGWGVATGVAIVKMKAWARISMLAFGAILCGIAVFGSLEMARDPYAGLVFLEGGYLGSIRPKMMVFYGVLAALGVFWPLFFSRNSVRARFAS